MNIPRCGRGARWSSRRRAATLDDALEVLIRRVGAERFIEEVSGDDPEVRRSSGSKSGSLMSSRTEHAALPDRRRG